MDNDSVGTRIDIVSDVICPWCFIGKRHLERALAALTSEGLVFSVHWNPFQLNPAMPKEGRERAAYRAWKFGSAEDAAAADRRTTEAAAGAGLAFRIDLMTRTPNTMDAHRLIWFAGTNGVQDAMVESLFQAYFIEGLDIGDHAVLANRAASVGLSRKGAADFLATDLADAELREADQAAREQGVNGVPSFFLDGHMLFSGAMPVEAMVQAFRRGRAILRQRQAAEAVA